MRKNMRRSVVLAAAVSGIWALGAASAASAGAAELPTHDTGSLTDTVKGGGGLVGHTLHGVKHTVGGVQHTVSKTTKSVQKTTDGLTKGATGKLPTGKLTGSSAGSDVTGTVSGLGKRLPAADQLGNAGKLGKLGHLGQAGELGKAADLNKAARTAQQKISAAAQGLPAGSQLGNAPDAAMADNVLPAQGLPSVPQVPGVNCLGQLPHLPALPAVPPVGHIASHAAAKGLRPGQLTAALPAGPGKQFVVRTLPVVQQAAQDTGATVDNATATTTPFANLAVGQTDFLVHNASGDVISAGAGLGAGVEPFATQLGTGVSAHVQQLAGHAASGAQNGGIVPGHGVPTLPTTLPTTLPSASALPSVPAV